MNNVYITSNIIPGKVIEILNTHGNGEYRAHADCEILDTCMYAGGVVSGEW